MSTHSSNHDMQTHDKIFEKKNVRYKVSGVEDPTPIKL